MRRSKSAIFLHFVWGTWDRLPLLTGEREDIAHRAIGAKCAELATEIIALGGVEDHIHLLVDLPTTICVADFIKHAKGASAHLISHQFAPDFFRWQGAYGVFSVSFGDLPRVSKYIHNQRQHHQFDEIIPEWEMPIIPPSITRSDP